jgi:type VI secretion system secreted protein VgrG
MARTQTGRLLALGTPLGEDVLLLRRFTGVEQLGSMFSYDLDMVSEQADIVFEKIVGQNVTIRLELLDGSTRYFNGYVSRFVQTGAGDRLVSYRATVVPWLWFLTRVSDCRIFQEMTVPDIIKEVFRSRGFSDFDDSGLSGTYRTWEYCVQYRESDFNFVSRLMEHEGIYYYFKHENGKHTLMLADSSSAHTQLPGYSELPFRPPSKARFEYETIESWIIEKQVQSGVAALTDFDFINPKKSLEAKAAISRTHAVPDLEVFEFPGGYTKPGEGDHYARVRIEELQAQYEVATAKTDARGITPGYLFKMVDYPRADQNREYLITGATYEIVSDHFESADNGRVAGEPERQYHCTFTAIEAHQPFRPPRTTPKPLIQGPQTAIVVGKSGEEIWTDEHGRVKVQFHWDRYSHADEKSSCWIRVAQSWAGKKWGAMFLPRIGQEVIVEFLEGDPDRPIITGRVYNGDNKTPYDLPANATRSGIKTLSSKGGGGFNEIRFEDKKGEEEIFIHAEKDLQTRVKNDRVAHIGRDQHLIVEQDLIEKIGRDHHLTVVGDHVDKTEGDRSTSIVGDHMAKVDGSDHLTVGGDRMVEIRGDDNLKVTGKLNFKSNDKVSIDSAADIHQKSGAKIAVDAAGAIHIKSGAAIVIEGASQISLKVGGNFIDIGPSGVSISGTAVNINTGGAAGSGGGCSVTAPATPDAPDDPKAPVEAITEAAGQVEEPPPPPPAVEPWQFSPAAQVLKDAAQDGTPFCEECEKARKEQAAGGAS